ncbi:putative ABC transport system ATP-binding protein [Micromonospora rhizosphaerae]|uniref:Putative ABC transport system ATP-binding protein n=1 Tax=Micromonospora rhizosphaerae TaxID=568872 RepID=A0A1C6RDK5_9ACTN|nr:ABC transporter ATP-binding protein [Micromonospora rhizosphaerae]SCL15229.1 putative ABC transport system ATP-binding protein [Micromonospora rhizosphaerae]
MTLPVVRFEAVGMTYPGPPPVPALLPADLTIEQGEYVTVVGRSGSGKSTFLNIVGLLDRPTTGRYELDGIDVGRLREADRSTLRGRRVGFVFQSFHLLPYRSAVENVALAQLYTGPSARERRRTALDVLERVGLAHRADALPMMLSGGERQRVAIARALANQPSLLLCDEPTGNLDSETAATVLTLLDEVHTAGFTVIVITHDPEVAARSPRRITIRDGVLDG